MITVCLTYFRSLTLANLSAALYSVRRQDLSHVESIVVVDNNADDVASDIHREIDVLSFPVPVRLLSFKHGDSSRTHSWSTNVAVREAISPWVFFTRADYLLDFDMLRRCVEVVEVKQQHRPNWNGFVTSNCYQLGVDVAGCETTSWREHGTTMLRRFPGSEVDYTSIDTGVWLSTRRIFDEVGGLEEKLIAWGHAQTHFQYKLYRAGTEFVRIPEPLYFHTQHGAERDLGLAHQQLREQGINLRELWERYEGAKFY